MNIHTTCIRNEVYPIQMLVLSHSSRESFRSCARKLEFRQFYGENRGREDDNFAGNVGNALHRGLAKWLTTYDENKAMVAMLKSFPYDDRGLEACVATLDCLIHSGILLSYEIAKIKLADGRVVDCIEVPFAIQITGSPLDIPVWFVGIIDCILYDRIHDRYVVVDLKTTRQRSNDMAVRFEFDEQCIPYSLVLEHALGRSIEELEMSYFSVFIDLREPKPSMFPVRKTKDDVADWYRGLCDDIERIAKYYKETWFPRATSGTTCLSWNRRCQFYDVCCHRKPEILNSVIQGQPRISLFRDGSEPMITTSLPFRGQDWA
jgi:PD-(D/E)XK nuclease superfamily